MIDLHSHILPGIDDGAPDWNQTLQMAKIAAEDGIRAMVCTPHCISGFFENRRAPIIASVEQFRTKLSEAGIPLDVYPGAELRLDLDLGDRIESGEILSLNDTGRYALIELPPEVLPPHLENTFWDLQSRGITPILAHPERHPMLMHNPAPLYSWVESGVLTQITAASLMGRFGSRVRNFSVDLIEHRLAHILATDSHGPLARTPRLSSAFMEARAILGESLALEMIQSIPQLVLEGNPVSTCRPIPFRGRTQGRSFLGRLSSLFGGSFS
jgi:protein-tyrosine phosphatase